MPKNRDVQKNLDFFAGPTPSPGLRCLLYSLTSSLSSSKALGKQPTHHPSGAFEQPELNRQPGVTVRFSLTFSFGWVDGPSPFMLSPPTSNSKGAWWTWRYFAALKKASECLMPQKSQPMPQKVSQCLRRNRSIFGVFFDVELRDGRRRTTSGLLTAERVLDTEAALSLAAQCAQLVARCRAP